jgi:hypothetical protein
MFFLARLLPISYIHTTSSHDDSIDEIKARQARQII